MQFSLATGVILLTSLLLKPLGQPIIVAQVLVSTSILFSIIHYNTIIKFFPFPNSISHCNTNKEKQRGLGLHCMHAA